MSSVSRLQNRQSSASPTSLPNTIREPTRLQFLICENSTTTGHRRIFPHLNFFGTCVVLREPSSVSGPGSELKHFLDQFSHQIAPHHIHHLDFERSRASMRLCELKATTSAFLGRCRGRSNAPGQAARFGSGTTDRCHGRRVGGRHRGDVRGARGRR
jgi:hypothetical protein